MRIPNLNIVIIDDKKDVSLLFSTMLESCTQVTCVYTCSSLEEAIPIISSKPINVVVLDLNLEKTVGVDTLIKFKSLCPDIPVVVVTGLDSNGLSYECFSLGASEFLSKPDINHALLYKACIYAVEKDEIRKSALLTEATLRSLVDVAPIGIGVAVDRKMIWVNDYMCNMLSMCREELEGRNARLLYKSDEEYERVGNIKYPAVYEGKKGILETQWVTKDKRILDIFLGSAAIGPKTPSSGVIFTALDITTFKNTKRKLQSERDKAQHYLDVAGVMLLVLDLGGKISVINRKGCEILGYDSADELIGKDWFDVCIPETEREEVRKIFHKVIEDEKVPNYLMEHVNHVLRKDETERLIAWRNVYIKDNSEFVSLSSGEDITERKQAEDLLLESELKFSQAFRTAPYALTITRANDGKIIEVNDAFSLMSGYSREEVLHNSTANLRLWDNPEDRDKVIAELHTKGSVKEKEFKFRIKDGSIRIGSFSASFITLKNESYILSSINDITDTKEAQKDLAISEQCYRRLFEGAKDGILILDSVTGKIIDANPYVLELLGYTYTEAVQKFVWEVSPFKDTFLNKEAFEKLQQNGYIRYESLPLETRGGSKIDVEFVSNAYLVDDTTYLQCNIRNITDRKIAEEFVRIRLSLLEYSATHSLGELLQETLDEICNLTNSPIGFYHFINDDEKTIALQAWSTRTVEEFCQADNKEQHYPIDQGGVWVDAVRERHPVTHNNYAALPHRKGMPKGHAAIVRELVVPIMRSDKIVAILGIGNKPTDYTKKDTEICSYLADVAWEIVERKRTEEALKESEDRLKLLEMAKTRDLLQSSRLLNSGIAHELRTPMQAILNCLELIKELVCETCGEQVCPKLQECTEKTSNLTEFLDDGLERAEYSVKVLNSLAEYSKIASAEELHLVNVVAELKTIMRTLLFTDQFKGMGDEEFYLDVSKVPADGCSVLMNRIDFTQLISNLCRNAREAISTQLPRICVEVSREYSNTRIVVRDNGRGISPELGDKIFEPYFSTKENPDEYNQGLGLAMVRDIVLSYGGSIKYASQPGRTEFVVTLPCAHMEQN
jgi:PAS domain S-box-containing protein